MDHYLDPNSPLREIVGNYDDKYANDIMINGGDGDDDDDDHDDDDFNDDNDDENSYIRTTAHGSGRDPCDLKSRLEFLKISGANGQ